MIYGIVLSSTMTAVLIATPALAGPCAERIADLEKSVIAVQEGAGPALAPPASTSSGTSSPSSSAAGTQGVPAATPDSVRANAVLQMLSHAKQLDQQAKEAECMQIVTQAGAITASQTATAGEGQRGQPTQPGMMRQGMMGHGMMGGMMGGMRTPGGHGHMMKIMFAVADTSGDGALSFDEIAAVHRRIFDTVDSDKDGKVTLDEVEAFIRE